MKVETSYGVVSWKGVLKEETLVSVGADEMPFSTLIAMTNGDILIELEEYLV